jgi:hypothetical protein
MFRSAIETGLTEELEIGWLIARHSNGALTASFEYLLEQFCRLLISGLVCRAPFCPGGHLTPRAWVDSIGLWTAEAVPGLANARFRTLLGLSSMDYNGLDFKGGVSLMETECLR